MIVRWGEWIGVCQRYFSGDFWEKKKRGRISGEKVALFSMNIFKTLYRNYHVVMDIEAR
jgi:hypothetical protein